MIDFLTAPDPKKTEVVRLKKKFRPTLFVPDMKLTPSGAKTGYLE